MAITLFFRGRCIQQDDGHEHWLPLDLFFLLGLDLADVILGGREPKKISNFPGKTMIRTVAYQPA